MSTDAQLSQRGRATGCVLVLAKSRKPVCDFLLVINSNWHLISYRVSAAYCSNFGHFAFL